MVSRKQNETLTHFLQNPSPMRKQKSFVIKRSMISKAMKVSKQDVDKGRNSRSPTLSTGSTVVKAVGLGKRRTDEPVPIMVTRAASKDSDNSIFSLNSFGSLFTNNRDGPFPVPTVVSKDSTKEELKQEILENEEEENECQNENKENENAGIGTKLLYMAAEKADTSLTFIGDNLHVALKRLH